MMGSPDFCIGCQRVSLHFCNSWKYFLWEIFFFCETLNFAVSVCFVWSRPSVCDNDLKDYRNLLILTPHSTGFSCPRRKFFSAKMCCWRYSLDNTLVVIEDWPCEFCYFIHARIKAIRKAINGKLLFMMVMEKYNWIKPMICQNK